MAKTLQFRRDTTANLASVTGAEGEIFIDLTKDTVVVMDGSTAGGKPLATESYVTTAVSNIVDAAPSTLDTLNELAAALGDDANFSTSISNMIGVSGGYANSAFSKANTGVTNAATADQRAVTSGVYANTGLQRANTAGSYANSAYSKANTASNDALTALYSSASGYTHANAAFAKANTGSTGNFTFSANTISITSNVSANLTVSENVSAVSTVTYTRDPSGSYASNYFDYVSIDPDAKTLTAPNFNGEDFPNTLIATIGTPITVDYDSSATYWPIGGTEAPPKQVTITLTSYITSGSNRIFSFAETIAGLNYSNRVYRIALQQTTVVPVGRFFEFGKDSTLSIKKGANTSSISATSLIIDGTNVLSSLNGSASGSYANSAYTQANTGTILAQAAFDTANSAGGGGLTITDEASASSTYYPILGTITTGTLSAANTSSTKLTYVPSTGTLTAVDLNTTSDIQYKENVTPITDAINILNNIEGVSFNWKENGKKSYGVIAQELEKVLPELVSQGERGLSVSYLPLIALLIQAVKEQQQQINNLKQ